MKATPEDLKAVLRHYPTGITVVTVLSPEGMPYGLTVNAFMSLSMNPPSVVVSLNREGRTATVLERTGRFAVNLLGEGQEALVWRFADPRRTMAERFEGVTTEIRDGWVILLESVGVIQAQVRERIPIYDHVLFVGEVEEAGLLHPERSPLIYWKREVFRGPDRDR